MTETVTNLRQLAEQSNAWPFEEARKIVTRLKKHPKDDVIFETGYGPSGLPHIGTFGEVAADRRAIAGSIAGAGRLSRDAAIVRSSASTPLTSASTPASLSRASRARITRR